MDQDSGFENSFSKHARIAKFGLGIQALSIVFAIWFLIFVITTDSEDSLGAAAAVLIMCVIAAFLYMIVHMVFSASLMKFGNYRLVYKILAVCGVASCLLPLSGFLTVFQYVNDTVFKLCVALFFALLILSLKPVYYWLMRREIMERISVKQASRWTVLFIISIVFVLCIAVTLVVYRIPLFGNVARKSEYGRMREIITTSLAIISVVVLFVRMILEFFITSDTEKQLFETNNGKEDFPINVQN